MKVYWSVKFGNEIAFAKQEGSVDYTVCRIFYAQKTNGGLQVSLDELGTAPESFVPDSDRVELKDGNVIKSAFMEKVSGIKVPSLKDISRIKNN